MPRSGVDRPNPRRHAFVYRAPEAGLWLIAETALVFAYPGPATHQHDVVQVVAVLDGALRLHRPWGACDLHAGQVAVIPAGQAHAATAHSRTARCRILDIRVDAPLRSPLAHALGRLAPAEPYAPGVTNLTASRDRLHQALTLHEPQRFAAVMSALWATLSLLGRPTRAGSVPTRHSNTADRSDTPHASAAPSGPDPGDARVAIAESFIHEHLHRPISTALLARAAHLSASQLNRLYREHLQTTPARRIEALRVARGYELLAGGTQSIQEIATACGYAGTAQFTRAFRRAYGRTPSEARQRIIASEAV